MRKAEKCAAYVWKREPLTANDNDLISVSLKIIRAPSSGRGRRAKRGGVGFPECGSTVSRGQPPPLRGTSFQRKEGEKRGCVYRHRYIGGEVGAFSAISATSEPAPYHFFSRGKRRGVRHMWGKRESLTAKVQGSRGGFAAIDGSGRSCSGIRYLTYDVSRRSG